METIRRVFAGFAAILAVGQLSLRAADAPANGTAKAVTASMPAPQLDNGYLKLGFEQLASYTFTPPAFDPAAAPSVKPPTGEEQIPATVKSWNGKKAVVTG